METEQAKKSESSQSRKVAVVSAGIAAIVAKDDFKAQCVVAVVVIAFIVGNLFEIDLAKYIALAPRRQSLPFNFLQGVLDYRKREKAGQ